MASNYEKMAAFSRELFLRHDQEAMIRLWDLEHDADGLYLPYFNERLRLDRHTATLSRAEDGDWPPTDFVHETMVLFDLLTYPAERPRASGRWASISMLGGIIAGGYSVPELTLANLHPEGLPVWPYMFVTVACGAVSGFHATQSPMIARCITSERQGRSIFYGAMIAESFIALI